MKIKTFGSVDERSLTQLTRCMEVGDAEFGVLCADHHPGYSQPIGGAIAYEGYVSPSGVGYDIGCIAASEPVLCNDGCTRPIEQVVEPVCADEHGVLRAVHPFLGVVHRGNRPVVRVVLANRREVALTGEHRVRTEAGWRRADELKAGDRVLGPVYVGMAHEACAVEEALLRVAGYVNGDGHISRRGNRVTLYTSKDRDAADDESDPIETRSTSTIRCCATDSRRLVASRVRRPADGRVRQRRFWPCPPGHALATCQRLLPPR